MATKCDNCERPMQYFSGFKLLENSSVMYTDRDTSKDFCQFKCLKEWIDKQVVPSKNLEFQKDNLDHPVLTT